MSQEKGKLIFDYELEDRFNEFLDYVYDVSTICGYKYSPSVALKCIDRIAYRESYNNWLDGEINEGE